MPVHPLDVAAATFTAGCMAIHAGCRRPDDVTLVLDLVMIGLVNVTGAAALARTGPSIDPLLAAELASYRPRHD